MMSTAKVWNVNYGNGLYSGMENITGDDEVEGLKDYDVEEAADIGIHVSEDAGIAQHGYEDHQPGSICFSDWGRNKRISACCTNASSLCERSGDLKLSPSIFVMASGCFENCTHCLHDLKITHNNSKPFKATSCRAPLSFSNLVFNNSPSM